MQSHAGTRRLEIVAWVENAVLVGPGIKLKAKLDTGAETSSISRLRTVRVYASVWMLWTNWTLWTRPLRSGSRGPARLSESPNPTC